jgi:hypothetical protein
VIGVPCPGQCLNVGSETHRARRFWSSIECGDCRSAPECNLQTVHAGTALLTKGRENIQVTVFSGEMNRITYAWFSDEQLTRRRWGMLQKCATLFAGHFVICIIFAFGRGSPRALLTIS